MLKCDVCNKTTGLAIVNGMLLCKEHKADLAGRCCAEVTTNRRLHRCRNSSYSETGLCVQHENAGAAVYLWEICQVCNWDRKIGESCPNCNQP